MSKVHFPSHTHTHTPTLKFVLARNFYFQSHQSKHFVVFAVFSVCFHLAVNNLKTRKWIAKLLSPPAANRQQQQQQQAALPANQACVASIQTQSDKFLPFPTSSKLEKTTRRRSLFGVWKFYSNLIVSDTPMSREVSLSHSPTLTHSLSIARFAQLGTFGN